MSIQEGYDAIEEAPLPSAVARITPRLYSTRSDLSGSSPYRILSEIERSTETEVLTRGPIPSSSSWNGRTGSANGEARDYAAEAIYARTRYYSKLDKCENSTLIMPPHVCPEECRVIFTLKKITLKKHSSFITIMSHWNTMMGTSLLCMPWALKQAGLLGGILIMLFFAAVTMYTAYLVLISIRHIEGDKSTLEFVDVCALFLGRWGYMTCLLFSVITLISAAAIYWVFMSNFLYFNIAWIVDAIRHTKPTADPFTSDIDLVGNYTKDVTCPHPPSHHGDGLMMGEMHYAMEGDDWFTLIWSTQTTPLFLAFLIIPLISIRNPTFFTYLNSAGIVAVFFIIGFLFGQGIAWGLHVDFSDTTSPFYIPLFKETFPALTGTLCLSFFIHNCTISIMRNQKNPENNVRDLIIAFILAAATYLLIGVEYYLTFPLDKGCIEDNLLNNFQKTYGMAITSRFCLLAQMVTVFPLLAYILRSQILIAVFGEEYPGRIPVATVNMLLVGGCVLVAILFPKIGFIIRFSGAICGLVYVFALPCLVRMRIQKACGELTCLSLLLHSSIIIIGVANVIGQVLISIL